MLLMVKGKGCRDCPLANTDDDSYECNLAYANLADGTSLDAIKPKYNKKPENCPLRGGGTFEISIEYED